MIDSSDKNTAKSGNKSAKKGDGKGSVAESVASGAGAVAGVGAGVVLGSVVAPDDVSASETVHHTTDDGSGIFDFADDNETVKATPESLSAHVETVEPVVSATPAETAESVKTTETVQTETVVPEDEVQVLSYERVSDGESGRTADIAVVVEDGAEVAYIDSNIDGIADLRVADANHDGSIDFESEAQDVSGQNIAMDPFRESFESQPDYNSNNDMADYVNNADVDNFMA